MLYAHRFTEAERALKRRVWKTLCDAFFSRYVPTRGTVLDVGAGFCDFINNVHAARRIAVDVNPETVDSASSGVEVHTISVERIGEVLDPASVDLTFASNVFEHLRSPDHLMDALGAIFKVLTPGGTLVVMQPNVGRLGGAFWDFVDHTLPLTEKGMSEALEISGFEVTERRAAFLPYTTKSPLPKWTFLVRLYLLFPPAQWLLGKQMLLVARRPE
jgi:SAM-dependent methyltransferase